MASAEREPITGFQGAEPPMGGQGTKSPPLKLNAFLFLHVQRKLQICPIIKRLTLR